MPLINLIQEQRLATKRDERRARSYFFAFVGIGVLSAGGYLTLLMQTDSLESEVAGLQAQMQIVKPLMAEIDKNDKDYNAISPRVKTLEDAQLCTERWDRILNHLAHQTPTNAWLTGLRCTVTDPQKPVSASFTGMAPDQEPVGEYILRLQNSDDLDNVQLKYTQEKMVQQTRGIEFEISADIADSADQPTVVKQEAQS